MSNETILDQPITRISSEKKEKLRQFFLDIWMYRDLFRTFLERDIKIRYRQTALGILWVILQPLVTAGAFSFILGKMASLPVGTLPYFLFYLTGFVPWVSFAQAITQSATSLEQHAGLISKVYFPRIIAPWAAIVGTIPDFIIGFIVLNIAALVAGHWSLLLLLILPILLTLQLLTACGLGAILAALNAQFRDVRYVIPFAVQTGMLITPVLYPLQKLPTWGQSLLYLNPMAGIIECYRWALGGDTPPLMLLSSNVICTLAYITLGILFFRSRETKLMDTL